jgi:hypothetical protein
MEIKIGDKVRSYDFPGVRDDCYMEGTVIGFTEIEGCNRYIIATDRYVLEGKFHTAAVRRVYPPVNGTPKLFGGVCDGVVKI